MRPARCNGHAIIEVDARRQRTRIVDLERFAVAYGFARQTRQSIVRGDFDVGRLRKKVLSLSATHESSISLYFQNAVEDESRDFARRLVVIGLAQPLRQRSGNAERAEESSEATRRGFHAERVRPARAEHAS